MYLICKIILRKCLEICFLPSVKECVENLSTEEDKDSLVASLWGAERCLRVLESVSGHQMIFNKNIITILIDFL